MLLRDNKMMDNERHTERELTDPEARILGCLMEKQLTTPNAYPLTFNALTNACNQKSNREPVMNLAPGEVEHTAKELDLRGLVRIDYGERSDRVSQRFTNHYSLDKKQQALMSVLMLHYPQTVNDLRRRTDRMVEWSDTTEIELSLLELQEHEPALVTLIPKSEGRREDRYAQTLCGEIDAAVLEQLKSTSATSREQPIDTNRLDELEQRIAALEHIVRQLQGGSH